jgi:hypothetical protein
VRRAQRSGGGRRAASGGVSSERRQEVPAPRKVRPTPDTSHLVACHRAAGLNLAGVAA